MKINDKKSLKTYKIRLSQMIKIATKQVLFQKTSIKIL